MNNVELARTYCHGEKTHFSRNEKEQFLSPYRSFCVNFARHPHPSAWGTPIIYRRMNDEYKTIDGIGQGVYTEKRSKFLAYAHPVDSVEQVKDLLANYRKQHYDARHVCYAYMLGSERQEFRANDDGEPSSTAGKPILGQINSHELTNILVVVVRYYGGVNLGTGGLIVAYRTAAALAIDNAPMVSRLVEETVSFTFPYVMMNGVMRVVKESEARILATNFENTCEIKLSIVRSKAEELRNKLNKLSFG